MTMTGLDQPPSVQDGKFGFEPDSDDGFMMGDEQAGQDLDPRTGKKVALAAYMASTNWLNAGRRAAWADSLRAFQSVHATGSKYNSREYAYRSNLYRPKTRSTIRKAEAHTATAFFSNEDVVSITATDDNDPKQQASAAILQALLDYRLKVSVPWFLTVVGARQDCEVMGICISKADWDYEEKKTGTEVRAVTDPDTGEVELDDDGFAKVEEYDVMEIVKDEPRVDLISPENVRFDPGCDWRDPVKTSPYFIEMMPLYIDDVKERMRKGEWKEVAESALRNSSGMDDDVTRRSRENGRIPGKDNDAWKPEAFEICWVRNNIIRFGGQDWQFYTLASAGELLTDPRPIKEVYLHGERPYVCGFVVLETHKTYPSGKPELTKDLQRAANDDWNLRFDVLKLQLNPRLFIKTGSGIDPQDARTFMPGKIVLMKGNPGESIQWERPPSPGAEVYQEEDRINQSWDDLVGNMSQASVQSAQLEQQSATGMNLMSGEASGVAEYELRVFAETWAEPMFRLLIKLEQAYETDQVILEMAGKNAQLWERFGIDDVTDELLKAELTCRANVGIGATNPQHRLKNLAAGAEMMAKMFTPEVVAQGLNFQEFSKEVFGALGYRDGSRFFNQSFDPRVVMLQQELQKLQGKDKGGEAKQPDQTRVQAAQITSQARLQEAQLALQQSQQENQTDLQIAAMKEDAQRQRDREKLAHDAAMAHVQHNLGQFAANAAVTRPPPPQPPRPPGAL